MTKLLVTASLTALALTGCVSQSSIGGRTLDGSVVFSGRAIGKWRDLGVMRLTTDRGVVCEGSFTYDGSNSGEGTARCTDGKTATFNFTTALGQGRGTGVYGNKPFTFNFVR
jgi:hypothetical protein